MLPCLRSSRFLAAEHKLAQTLSNLLVSYRTLAREGSAKGQRTAPRDLPKSNYFPNLAAYFAGSTGSAVVVTTGVPCATGGGSATGTRTCSVEPGDVPAGTVIRTVEPSEAFASMDSPSLAPVWKSASESGANEAPRNLISAQRGTGRHGHGHDMRRLGPAQVRELPLKLAEVADDVLRCRLPLLK